MTKQEKEEHLKEKMLLYSKYQIQLNTQEDIILTELESLRSNVSKAIDQVLVKIDLGLEQNELI